jgi:hypothetical protein
MSVEARERLTAAIAHARHVESISLTVTVKDADEILSLLSAAPPPSVQDQEARRERIARVIDPEAWVGDWDHEAWHLARDWRRKAALAKADQIIKDEQL